MFENNKKLKISFLVISAFLLIGSVIVDFLIKNRVLHFYLIVNENYIYYIFSLIFTVATLGCTLLSIIVAASNNKTLGLQLKEIVSLTNSPLRLKALIIGTLTFIALSIPLLAFECNTAMTFLAIELIVFIVYHTVILCKIVFDELYTKNIIALSLNKSNNLKSNYVQYWLTSLSRLIEENDIAQEEEYISLLRSAANTQTEYCNQIREMELQLFEKSCKYQSFVDSYKRIIRLGDVSKCFFDERAIIFNYFNNLKYVAANDKNIVNFPGTLENIILCDFISSDDKTNIGFWFFNTIFDNLNIANKSKMDLIFSGLKSLLWLDDKFGFCDVRIGIAQLLFKNNILLADDYALAKEIYKILIKALYVSNKYRFSRALNSLIAKITRMIYFWSYLEVEALSEKQRKFISELPSYDVDTNDNARLSISFLIEQHHDGMIEFLIEDALIQNWNNPFDYMPDIMNGKTVVSTPENKIKFALWFYAIWGYGFCVFPVKQLNIISDTDPNFYLVKSVYNAIREEFNSVDKTLNEKAKEHIVLLQRLYRKKTLLPQQYLLSSFDEINSEIKRMNDQALNEIKKASLTSIVDKLMIKMKDEQDLKMDDSICLDQAPIFQLAPLMCFVDNYSEDYIVSWLKDGITNIVNKIIDKRLREVSISFDHQGVITLKEELDKATYNFRNYTYYDDWGIDQSTRATDDYEKLKGLINSIKYVKKRHLLNNLFLFLDDVKFNYSVETGKEELLGETLEKYLEQFRIADEQYVIDNAVYSNKESAKKYLKKARFILNSKIKIETNVKTNSGFKVTF